MRFDLYDRKGRVEARKYEKGESLHGVYLPKDVDPDKDMGYICRDPGNKFRMWYVERAWFEGRHDKVNRQEY